MNSAIKNLKLLVGMPEKTARGGINACEPPMLRSLEKSGVEVSREIYIFDNDERISLYRRAKQVWRTALSFRRRLQREKFDVVHLNTSFDRRSALRDAFTLFVLKGIGPAVFLKFHGSDLEFLESAGFLSRILIRYVVRNAGGIGLLSTEELRGFTAFGFPPEKFFVVKNALTEYDEPDGSPVARDPKHGPFKLLFVSRLIPTKGLNDTVSAVAMLRDQGRDVFLNVLGDGEAREDAEKLAASLGVSDLVRFHGHVSEDEVREFYSGSDLLVFPTFHCEGFPMVIFNSMRFGLPIVTTRIRAAADLLKDRENCLFCEGRNPADVAAKIAELIGDGELRATIAESNKKLAASFSAANVAPEYLEVYRKIMRGK